MQCAAVDIGTNSVLATVAHYDASSQTLTMVEECIHLTRLGQGIQQTGQLHPEAIARTLDALQQVRQMLDRHAIANVAMVGTSALRRAEGQQTFICAAETCMRCPLKVIDGSEEAELTFRGALLDLPEAIQSRITPVMVIDPGGGSTGCDALPARDLDLDRSFHPARWSR